MGKYESTRTTTTPLIIMLLERYALSVVVQIIWLYNVVLSIFSQSMHSQVHQNFSGFAQMPLHLNPYYLYGNASMTPMPLLLHKKVKQIEDEKTIEYLLHVLTIS